MYSDYKKRLLYKQKAQTDEGHNINVSVWATRWTYPGASHSTTGRARISTITNFTLDPEVAVGTIETWRDTGWVLVEEYMDTQEPLVCEDDVESECLKILEAFLMGVNFEYTGDDDTTAPPFTMTDKKPSKRRKTSSITIKPMGDNPSDDKPSAPADDKGSIDKMDKDDDDSDSWI
jgi:hypothetical protein